MYKKMKYIFILILMLIVASGKIKAEELAAGSYKIGDKITYNGMEFYVIENSDEASDSVTMLKAEPLTVDEVNKYGVGHVNRYTVESVGTAYNQNGYGGMAYYSSETCGYTTPGDHGSYVETGCTTDYAQSDIKCAVDAWIADKIKSSDLKEDSLGYKVRLITYDELFNNLGYSAASDRVSWLEVNPEYTLEWVYNSNYWYWTMSQYEDSTSRVWDVYSNGNLSYNDVNYNYGVVRPVITLSKKVEPIVDSDNKEITSTEKVNVPNTFLNKTVLWLIIGIITIIISVIIIYILIKGRRQRK